MYWTNGSVLEKCQFCQFYWQKFQMSDRNQNLVSPNVRYKNSRCSTQNKNLSDRKLPGLAWCIFLSDPMSDKFKKFSRSLQWLHVNTLKNPCTAAHIITWPCMKYYRQESAAAREPRGDGDIGGAETSVADRHSAPPGRGWEAGDGGLHAADIGTGGGVYTIRLPTQTATGTGLLWRCIHDTTPYSGSYRYEWWWSWYQNHLKTDGETYLKKTEKLFSHQCFFSGEDVHIWIHVLYSVQGDTLSCHPE